VPSGTATSWIQCSQVGLTDPKLERTSLVSRLGRHSLKTLASEILTLDRTQKAFALTLLRRLALLPQMTETVRGPPVTISPNREPDERKRGVRQATYHAIGGCIAKMVEKRWSSMLGAIKRLSTLKLSLAYLKAEVNERYYEFKRQLYRLAINNQIHAALFYMNLGQIHCM
ncbi:hypothetical protein PSTT_16710, partial [Puccinia striiformis]